MQCEGKTNFKVWKEVEDHSIKKQIQLDMSNEKPILDVIMETEMQYGYLDTIHIKLFH